MLQLLVKIFLRQDDDFNSFFVGCICYVSGLEHVGECGERFFARSLSIFCYYWGDRSVLYNVHRKYFRNVIALNDLL